MLPEKRNIILSSFSLEVLYFICDRGCGQITRPPYMDYHFRYKDGKYITLNEGIAGSGDWAG